MADQPLRIVFAGTPEFAATSLQALLDAGQQIVAVYCQPDRPSGRGKKLQAGPVKQLALSHQIPVEQPVNFKSTEEVSKLASYQADLMIVVAYGLLLPSSVLTTPRFGCVNIHGSLLPKWRGAAPIHRSIEAGDEQTGITIMQMDEGLDTGNMLLKRNCAIDKAETGSSLHDKLANLGGEAIVAYLNNFDESQYSPNQGEVQDNHLACYAHKLTKSEAEIDWQLPAQLIEQKIRAFNAWPVCYTFVNEKRLRIWQAEVTKNQSTQQPGRVVQISKQGIEVVCGDGATLLLTQLQADGAKAMDCTAFLNARRDWFDLDTLLGKSPK